MAEPESSARTGARPARARGPGVRRATVIGAGSFGTALAVLLVRGGLRTTLQTRTVEQAETLQRERETGPYLPGVELPPTLRVDPVGGALARSDYVFLAVPSQGLDDVIGRLEAAAL